MLQEPHEEGVACTGAQCSLSLSGPPSLPELARAISQHLPINVDTLWPCCFGPPEPQLPHLHKGDHLAHGGSGELMCVSGVSGKWPGDATQEEGQKEGSQQTG